VTEFVTGLDVVEWMILLADGQPIPSYTYSPKGHSIQARVYAENPDKDF